MVYNLPNSGLFYKIQLQIRLESRELHSLFFSSNRSPVYRLYDKSTDTLPYISYECIGNEEIFVYTILK
jgi:hypothetical protein